MSTTVMGPALLFCPADRPDRYLKAAYAADSVILDLEDAVAPDQLESARAAVVTSQLDPARTIVRVNPLTSPEHVLDVEAIRRTDYRRIMLPKAESADATASVKGFDVIALCETSAGIQSAGEIATADNVVAVMWGAEDLMVSLSGTSSRTLDGRYRAVVRHARSTVLIASAAAGKAAIDSVFLDLEDLAGLAEEADDAAASGFAMKACIHPRQVPVVKDAFEPTQAELSWAARVIDSASGNGVFRLDGQMIDAPLVRQAERILSRART